jgi:hypothetical protein
VSPVWWAVAAGLLLLAVVIYVTGYLRLRWLLREEHRAYGGEVQPHVPEPGVVTVTLTADIRGFVEALGRAERAAADMAKTMRDVREALSRGTSQSFARLREELEWRGYLQRQMVLAQHSARLGVRAGVDPAYRTPEALHALVANILHWSNFTESERRELAVSAMHGWAHGWGRNQPRPVLANVRHYGNATVTVVSP